MIPSVKEEGSTTISGEVSPSFSSTLEMNGISFLINETGDLLRITPSGLEVDNSPLETSIVGRVVNAESEDLDSDGWPEIVVYTQSTDNLKKGDAFGFSVLNGKSLNPIFLPPLVNDEDLASGYVGGDEFAIVETSLVRRFILDDGSTRQIQYKLKNGENSKIFYVDMVVEY